MIHGEKDAYIGTNIARALFAEASEPKEMWVVPKAKHNRCREIAPEAYAERVVGFLRRFGPRRELDAAESGANPGGPGRTPRPSPGAPAAHRRDVVAVRRRPRRPVHG